MNDDLTITINHDERTALWEFLADRLKFLDRQIDNPRTVERTRKAFRWEKVQLASISAKLKG